MKDYKIAQSIVGTSKGRPKDDFYPTPPEATMGLLSKFSPCEFNIWEPACGDGAISKVLDREGYNVISQDLYDHGYGETGVDFLESKKREYNVIITNPPYNLAEKFIAHALDLGVCQIAMLLKLAFLEGQRRSAMLENSPLADVMVFRKRLTMTRNGEPMRSGGMIAFAWFIWDTSYTGSPRISWLDQVAQPTLWVPA